MDWDIRCRCEPMVGRGSECSVIGDTLAWHFETYGMSELWTYEEMFEIAKDEYQLTKTQLKMFSEYFEQVLKDDTGFCVGSCRATNQPDSHGTPTESSDGD